MMWFAKLGFVQSTNPNRYLLGWPPWYAANWLPPNHPSKKE